MPSEAITCQMYCFQQQTSDTECVQLTYAAVVLPSPASMGHKMTTRSCVDNACPLLCIVKDTERDLFSAWTNVTHLPKSGSLSFYILFFVISMS